MWRRGRAGDQDILGFSQLALGQTVGLAGLAFFHPLALFVVLWDQRGHFDRVSAFIYSNINQIGGVGVRALTRNRVFSRYVHFCFHRCFAHKAHLRLDSHQVSGADRLAKDHLIYSHGDHPLLGVAHTGQRSRFVHKHHDPAAVHVAQVIGMFRMHHLCNGHTRGADGLTNHGLAAYGFAFLDVGCMAVLWVIPYPRQGRQSQWRATFRAPHPEHRSC